jgi:hypothetical protein
MLTSVKIKHDIRKFLTFFVKKMGSMISKTVNNGVVQDKIGIKILVNHFGDKIASL